MIAATLVELRALRANRWMQVVIGLAACFPLLNWLVDVLGNGVLSSGSDFVVTYSDAFDMTLVTVGLATVLVSAMIATQSHRHEVFQSLVVTGHPRDLLLMGRLAAAWLTTLAMGATSLGLGMALHLMTYTPGKGYSHFAIGNLSATQVATDVTVLALVLLGSATFVVGLASALRSVLATFGAIVGWYVFEQFTTERLESRWETAAEIVPLEQMNDVPMNFEAPWWSALRAFEHVASNPNDPAWAGSVLVLAGYCVVVLAAAMYRMLWRDA